MYCKKHHKSIKDCFWLYRIYSFLGITQSIRVANLKKIFSWKALFLSLWFNNPNSTRTKWTCVCLPWMASNEVKNTCCFSMAVSAETSSDEKGIIFALPLPRPLASVRFELPACQAGLTSAGLVAAGNDGCLLGRIHFPCGYVVYVLLCCWGVFPVLTKCHRAHASF